MEPHKATQMPEKSDPAPLKKPSSLDVFDGLSPSLKINYLVAMASNLSPTDKVRDKNFENSSIQELRAIGLLVRLGPQTASRLARLSRQDRANVSRTIKKLVEKDLGVKIANPEHKRSPLIWVTNGGMEYYKKLEPQLKSKSEQYVADFSEDDKEKLIDLLERYIANAR